MSIKKTAVLMFGIQGTTLSDKEKSWLNNSLTAGIILFSRNYKSIPQLKDLIRDIRTYAETDILVGIDHEGGRVQRLQEGVTKLPAMGELGEIYDQDQELGIQLSHDIAVVSGYELRQLDIDLSFAPVLDIQNNISTIIGDRAFHSDPQKITKLAVSFYRGSLSVGMKSVGKHFPGHGNIESDSHLELPIAKFSWDEIKENDLIPFKELIKNGIQGIMPAHILYPKVDGMPAGFSNLWLGQILRKQLGFDGCIISDDLDMAGAAAFGSIMDRVGLAVKNCDMVLLCNNEKHIEEAFLNLTPISCDKRQKRLENLLAKKTKKLEEHYNKSMRNLINSKILN